jgi:hypothetical protein
MRIERTHTVTIPDDATFHELYQVTLAEWLALPTLSQTQDADLKYSSENYRVWCSRMHVDDYFPEQAQTYSDERLMFERLVDGRWIMLDRYGRRK